MQGVDGGQGPPLMPVGSLAWPVKAGHGCNPTRHSRSRNAHSTHYRPRFKGFSLPDRQCINPLVPSSSSYLAFGRMLGREYRP
jgi:hypothetical protein